MGTHDIAAARATHDTTRTWRGRRRVAGAAAGAASGLAALLIGGTGAFAHHVVSTTPTPNQGTVGATQLRDDATVYADSTRDVTFMLWAPGTCGVKGATPEFTDTEEVATQGLQNSDVWSAAHVPSQVGVYAWTVEIIVDSNNSVEWGPTACTDETVNVVKASPSIATTPSKGGPVGTEVSDSATVSGGDNPTGTVTFRLFPPSDADCSSTDSAVYTNTADLAGGSAHSGSYTTKAVGTYHWTATYSGDANNNPVASTCADEEVTTTAATPSIVTSASAGGSTGVTVSDSATVSGGNNPTGTVTFKLYGPSDSSCSGNPLFTTADKPLNNGAAHSDGFSGTTAAGTYNWIATYSGDANNSSVRSTCGDEPVNVTAPTGSVQSITDVTTPSTGAELEIRMAMALVVVGAGLIAAFATEAIARRVHKRHH